MPDLPSRRRLRGALPEARHGRLRRSRPWLTALTWVASGLAVVLVSTTAVAGTAVWSIASAVTPGVELIGPTDAPPPDIGAYDGGFNLLLVGSDSGEGRPEFGKRDAALNDVTMLVHVSGDHSNATVVSFPRDMFIPHPSCPREGGRSYSAMSSAKVNTSLSRGGLACVVHTIASYTGLEIPFAAKLEMGGVIDMADAVGGVEVCVATPINDRQIGLKLDAGVHSLSGWEAQLFLRSRYGVTNGTDLSRIDNQYVFLSSLLREMKSSETLCDPETVLNLPWVIAENLQLWTTLENINTLV